MNRKLTITVSEAVYEGLHRVIGRRHISRFIENLARPHVVQQDVEGAYRDMAADQVREQQALEWSEGGNRRFPAQGLLLTVALTASIRGAQSTEGCTLQGGIYWTHATGPTLLVRAGAGRIGYGAT